MPLSKRQKAVGAVKRHPVRSTLAGAALVVAAATPAVCNYNPDTVPDPARGSDAELVVPATYSVIDRNDQVGAFRTNCQRAEYGVRDPIVYPGQDRAGHLHMFFGAVGLRGDTATPLDVERSTCEGGRLNRTGYWVPAMLRADGSIVDAAPIRDSIQVYYKTTHYKGWKTTPIEQWFPDNLKMIAGNARGTVLDQDRVGWSCQESARADVVRSYGSIPTDCPRGHLIQLRVEFPDCWDGENLDSPDHKSHMTYGNADNRSGCPSTHPVPLPAITEFIRWVSPGPGAELDSWHISSDLGWEDGNRPARPAGGWGTTAHADWWNGWDGQTATQIVDNCLRPQIDCSMNLLGDGSMLTWDPDAGRAEEPEVGRTVRAEVPPNAADTPQ